jgi:hypothetical protein
LRKILYCCIQPKIFLIIIKFFEFAGAGGGLIDNLGYPYCRGRVFDDLEEDKGHMMMKRKSSGLQDAVFLSVLKILGTKWF